MNIELLQPGDEARWDAFVDACSDATFFHRSGWKRVIEAAFGHKAFYLQALDGGELKGILPLVRVKSLLFGDALVSIPFGVYGGAAAADPAAVAPLIAEAEGLGARLGVDYVELRCVDRPQADWPTKDLYVTFRREIAADEEANLKAIPRKQRAMIRKGQDMGLSSVVDDGVDRLFRMYSESVRNLGTPVFSKRYLALLKAEFGAACDVLTILADDGSPVASVMSFYHRDQVLPFYGGGTARARELHANDFMYWELMRRSAAAGLRVFDFGRSKVGSGSYRFKKHWGFEPEPLHYQFRLVRAKKAPDLSPANPRYRRMIEAWRRLPLPVANFLGPRLSRNLG